MANHKSAIKRIRQTEKRTAYNRIFRSRARTLVKKARTAILSREMTAAQEATRQAIQDLDKAASLGVPRNPSNSPPVITHKKADPRGRLFISLASFSEPLKVVWKSRRPCE